MRCKSETAPKSLLSIVSELTGLMARACPEKPVVEVASHANQLFKLLGESFRPGGPSKSSNKRVGDIEKAYRLRVLIHEDSGPMASVSFATGESIFIH